METLPISSPIVSILTFPDRPLARQADFGMLLFRLAIAAVFIYHGAVKLFEYGPAGTAQFFGSIGIPLPYLNA